MGQKRTVKSAIDASELMRRRQDEVRKQIRASNLVDVLDRAARGEKQANGAAITSTSIQAAIALLRKVLPDLSSIDQTVTGDESRPVRITITNA